MGKISKDVSSGLGAAIKEAQDKIKGNSSEELLNSGVKKHKDRKVKAKQEENAEDNSLFNALIPKEEKPKKEQSHMKTYEEVCQEDIQKAHDRGYEDPDFDFRSNYQRGQIIYYVLVGRNTKELKKLTVRTVYPRMMVCNEEKAACVCIGYKERDYIFGTPYEAKPVYDSIKLDPEEGVKSPKSGSKNDDGIVEEDGDTTASYVPDLSSD